MTIEYEYECEKILETTVTVIITKHVRDHRVFKQYEFISRGSCGQELGSASIIPLKNGGWYYIIEDYDTKDQEHSMKFNSFNQCLESALETLTQGAVR